MSGTDKTLSRRQEQILQSIVNTHIRTAETVGSRTVAKTMGNALSPASIRNVMADLEEMGYVCQPHRSAGRIPTEAGYRHYVDALMETYEVELVERRRFDDLYLARLRRIEEILDLTTRVLSTATHYTAVVQRPTPAAEKIERVSLVPLASGKVVAVIVTNTGDVRKHMAELREDVSDLEIERIAAFLNDRLRSLTFYEASELLDSVNESDCPGGADMADMARQTMDETLCEDEGPDVFLNGVENIFDQPEFKDLSAVRPVLKVFDEKKGLNELLECAASGDGARCAYIRIGSENSVDGVRNCSVVASPYHVGGRASGAVGVIGPTRMRYSRTSSLVTFVAERLGRVLTEICGG